MACQAPLHQALPTILSAAEIEVLIVMQLRGAVLNCQCSLLWPAAVGYAAGLR